MLQGIIFALSLYVSVKAWRVFTCLSNQEAWSGIRSPFWDRKFCLISHIPLGWSLWCCNQLTWRIVAAVNPHELDGKSELLPTSLSAAVAALEADSVLRQVLGEPLVKAVIGVRKVCCWPIPSPLNHQQVDRTRFLAIPRRNRESFTLHCSTVVGLFFYCWVLATCVVYRRRCSTTRTKSMRKKCLSSVTEVSSLD